jgi:hypothetical protein
MELGACSAPKCCASDSSIESPSGIRPSQTDLETLVDMAEVNKLYRHKLREFLNFQSDERVIQEESPSHTFDLTITLLTISLREIRPH